MLFSSISFLYYFLPSVLLIYFVVPKKWRNLVLLVFSLFFYFCGEPVYTLLLVFSSISDYLHSLFIEKYRGTKKARAIMISSVVINLATLGFFKYTDFFISNINFLFGTDIPLLKIPLPIGISFFTFQTMSYSIDVYRGDVKAEKNLLTMGTYVCLFPQLVAGPIVRYQTIAEELQSRTHSLERFASGITRFAVGLGKKVLLANTLGELGSILGKSDATVLSCWLCAFAFALQIYFDFSGYSDMAIGLGAMFGFTFPENFNYPYISTSITEFWRRWHMTLGSWFRDYIYIPLGGNRVSKPKWLRNIFIVWFVTGFWHGASWNFIIWGLFFGVLLTLEKLFYADFLKRHRIFAHIYTLFAVLISFVIFNVDASYGISGTLLGMFGFGGVSAVSAESVYYLRSYAVLLIIGIIAATPLPKIAANKIFSLAGNGKNAALAIVQPVFCGLILILCTGFLIDNSFNPFLYFRF